MSRPAHINQNENLLQGEVTDASTNTTVASARSLSRINYGQGIKRFHARDSVA